MTMVTATTEPVRLPPGTAGSEADPDPSVPGSNHANVCRSVAAVRQQRGQRESAAQQPCGGDQRSSPGQGTVQHRAPIWSNARPSGAGSIGEAFGPGSTFSLAGDEHRERRKLLVPPFHGKRMRSYEPIIEEEVMREIATWPEGREFETLASMTSITRRRDPARRVRRRRSRAGRASRTGAAHGHARLSWS